MLTVGVLHGHRPRRESRDGAGRITFGTWRFPSGNRVAAFLEPPAAAPPLRVITFEWLRPPPLGPADARGYRDVVLPAVIDLASEYLEVPGPALVVAPAGWPER